MVKCIFLCNSSLHQETMFRQNCDTFLKPKKQYKKSESGLHECVKHSLLMCLCILLLFGRKNH